MTYERDYTISEELMEEVCEQGLDALPELMRIDEQTAWTRQPKHKCRRGGNDHWDV